MIFSNFLRVALRGVTNHQREHAAEPISRSYANRELIDGWHASQIVGAGLGWPGLNPRQEADHGTHTAYRDPDAG